MHYRASSYITDGPACGWDTVADKSLSRPVDAIRGKSSWLFVCPPAALCFSIDSTPQPSDLRPDTRHQTPDTDRPRHRHRHRSLLSPPVPILTLTGGRINRIPDKEWLGPGLSCPSPDIFHFPLFPARPPTLEQKQAQIPTTTPASTSNLPLIPGDSVTQSPHSLPVVSASIQLLNPAVRPFDISLLPVGLDQPAFRGGRPLRRVLVWSHGFAALCATATADGASIVTTAPTTAAVSLPTAVVASTSRLRYVTDGLHYTDANLGQHHLLVALVLPRQK